MKEGWEKKKLGYICDTMNGLWTGKKPPFINIQVISLKSFTKDCQLKHEFTPIEAEVKHFQQRKLQYGDIIVEKSGGSDTQPVGRPVFFDIKEGDYSFCNFTSALRVKDANIIKPNYLHKCLLAFYRQGVTLSLQSKTTGIHNLDFKGYLNLPIPVPPLSVQESIVSELDMLSGIISKHKALQEEYDRLEQSIFYDMFGDPVTNEKGWEVKKLGDECTEVKYGTSRPASEDGQYKYLRMGNLTQNGFLDLTDVKTIDIPDDEIEKCIVRKGDVLFNRTNSLELIGKTCLFDLDEPMVIAGYIIRVRLTERINPRYLVSMFNLPSIKTLLKSMAKGAVNQANINSQELKSIKVPLPPIENQNEYEKKFDFIEQMKAKNKAAQEEAEMLFNERMAYYF